MWHARGVRIRSCARASIVAIAIVACHPADDDAVAVTDRGWRAHELAVAAGERAATCADAGRAMQRVIAEHRQDFVAAIALDRDPVRLRAATAYIESHPDRYRDLETRMEALSDRCADDPTVQAAFRQMESP